MWCSLIKKIVDTKFESTGETITLSGFGTGEQTGCKIYKGSSVFIGMGKV